MARQPRLLRELALTAVAAVAVVGGVSVAGGGAEAAKPAKAKSQSKKSKKPKKARAVRGGAFSYRAIAKMRNGRLRVRVTCRSPRTCRMQLRATRSGKRKVGSLTATVRANRTRTLGLRLTRESRRVIRRNRGLKVTLTVRSRGQRGGRDLVVTRPVTIRR